MTIYTPMTKKELSQKTLDEYARYCKVIQEGRKNPLLFASQYLGIQLIDYQAWCFMESWTKPYILWLECRAAGKALALDTRLPTPYGYTTIGDVKQGDYLIDVKGNPTRVERVSEIFKGHDCYEVVFNDGEKIIADADHLWTVTDNKSRRWKCSENEKRYNITTKEIFKDYCIPRNEGWNEYKYQIPIVSEVKYDEQQLPIHPYLLGVWLGDGLSDSARICCGEEDVFEMSSLIEKCGYITKIEKYKSSKAYTIGVGGGIRGVKGSNKFKSGLNNLCLIKNKHIPDIYLYSSVEQRLELLRGLMDTDGHCDKQGRCEFSQANYNLITQVSQLLSSLGISNTVKHKNATCNGKLCDAYRISFTVDREKECFKLHRKLDRLKEHKNILTNSKVIISVKEIPSVPTKCVMVDNERGLFLCGNKYTVTHNSTLLAIFLMTKMLLIPNYDVYISTNSAQQSIETYSKLEKIALNQIPSFKTLTDIFANELEKQAATDSGFYHSPQGHKFKLLNGSQLVTLSTNLTAVRGRRGSVAFDESSWMSSEQFATLENFANVDTNFGLGTEKIKTYPPQQMPLQLIYASSAGDVEYPFFSKYQTFAKKMFLGDPNYFVCDFNAHTVMNYSSVNGEPIKSYLTQETIEKAIEEDPDLADRELFNKFRKGAGQNAIVKAETLIRNSTVRVPLLFNDTGKKKFIFSYDPARNFDGSILSIFQVINDKEIGYKLQLENVISMVDTETKAKTPLPMPQQLEIIKQALIDYNGERAAEWENILGFYIDAGSGGGGVLFADQLMSDW